MPRSRRSQQLRKGTGVGGTKGVRCTSHPSPALFSAQGLDVTVTHLLLCCLTVSVLFTAESPLLTRTRAPQVCRMNEQPVLRPCQAFMHTISEFSL